MNICDVMEVPYINIIRDENAVSKLAVLNVHPNLDSLTQLVIEYVNISDWQEAAILYESSLWLQRAAIMLETNDLLRNRIKVFDLDYTTNNEFRPTLRKVRNSKIINIILDCSIESLPFVLRQAMEVGLMTDDYNWVIANLDAHSIDLDMYRYSGVNITLFRILDTKHQILDLTKPNSNEANAEADNDVFNIDPETRKIDSNCYANNNANNNNAFPIYPEKFKSELIYATTKC